MYFCVVTREMVDSCMPTASAMSCRTSGFIASSPWSRKPRWCSTICVATFIRVSLRLCRLLMNQRASCSWLRMKVLSALVSARRTKPAYCGLTRRRGIASWFSSTSQRSLSLRTMTSGTTYSGSLDSICEPGRGLRLCTSSMTWRSSSSLIFMRRISWL
ncbi:hypothetical protein D3C76_1204710 [compost metagenome]